ncbi:eCIS core domain-containing protein [Saccharothrix sp. Mg75]|uniref:eCIS core domain-containing protein n=1 Tax=Saccharothrix sp. Mg75 TaxID=3445357 RepID=UPI003EEAE939
MHAHESPAPEKAPGAQPVHLSEDTRADGPGSRPSTQLSPTALVALQRTAGNTAVAGLLGEQAAVQRSTVPDVVASPGRPLAGPIRAEMEDRLGSDFSDVRVHADEAARRSATEIGARAYTAGSHVVLGEGGTDRHTLAHELVHVLQQRVGPVSGAETGHGFRVSDPADRFEREADAVATGALSLPPSGRATRTDPATAQASGTGDGQVQRAPGKRPAEGEQPGPASQRRKEGSPEAEVEDDDLHVSDWSDYDPNEPSPQARQGDTGAEQGQAGSTAEEAGGTVAEAVAEGDLEDFLDLEDIDFDQLGLGGNPGDTGVGRAQGASNPAHARKSTYPSKDELKEIAKRDPQLRTLDRIGRVLKKGMGRGEGITPHLAVRLEGDELHVAGNEQQPITPAQRQGATDYLAHVRGTSPLRGTKSQRRDASKTRRVVQEAYRPADLPEEWKKSVAAALKRSLVWNSRSTTDDDNARQTESRVHGEMNLLGEIVAQQKKSKNPTAEENGERTQILLGGNLMPCGACSWVIDAVNDVIGKACGFKVVATRTHGQLYRWDLPHWLTTDPDELDRQVVQEVRDKARQAGYELKDGKLQNLPSARKGAEPPGSDSE